MLCTQVLRTSFNSLCANTRLNSFGTSLGGRRPSFYSLWARLALLKRLYVLNGLVLRTSFYSLYFALILIFYSYILFLYFALILIFSVYSQARGPFSLLILCSRAKSGL